ncbi:MAG: TetR/AcrR family transcriptional regulator [Acidobacteria bacterium]|nr:TetR/AcrR family transcriptional regulator [Acidobacteriota bacterium]
MGITERRAREKDDLRRQILATATEMFVAEGYESVSMRKIAERIEYAPSTIYLYFKDKGEMVASICYDTFAELERRMEKIRVLELPPMETLRRSLREYLEFALENRSAYSFVMSPPVAVISSLDPKTFESIHEVALQAFDRLRTGMRLCMEAGEIAPGDLEAKVQATYLFVHGVALGLNYNCGFPFIDKDILLEHVLDRVLGSLK